MFKRKNAVPDAAETRMRAMVAKPTNVRDVLHQGSIFPYILRNPEAEGWQTALIEEIGKLKAEILKNFEKSCEGKYLGRVK